MPQPVSSTRTSTWRPGMTCASVSPSSGPSTTSCTENRSVPPPGIASRALTTLSIAASNSLTSMRAGCGSPLQSEFQPDVFGDRMLDQDARALEHAVDVHRPGIEHVPARKRQQLAGQAGGAVRRVAHRLEQPADRAEVAASIREIRLPEITVSRLLKSWAMPPVS